LARDAAARLDLPAANGHKPEFGMSWEVLRALREQVARETGTIRKEAALRVALCYPSPYRAAMSSLGYQTIYGILNRMDDVAADRAILPDDPDAYRQTRTPLLTLDREMPVSDYPVLAFSVAYELEIAGMADCLDLAGIPPLAADREGGYPIVIGGGPLTFSNPAPLAPLCDVILLGEGEEIIVELISELRDSAGSRENGEARAALLARLASRPGFYVPAIHGEDVPAVAQVHDRLLPARSIIISPDAELANMFLTEAARGCSRGCTYCVMRRSTNGGMRPVPVEDILGGIPAHARRVGLVGAAVTDHPRINDVVRGVVDSGREVGISSLRADRLNDELVGLLARGGYRTLTVAADGASERMRAFIERKTYERHLLKSAELAKQHGMKTVKIYMMVGIPGETDDDIDELIRFSAELSKVHHKIAFGIAPFVAKRNTPLDGEPFAGIPLVEHRLERLRRGLRGTAEMRPTSARWAWVEYMLAQGDRSAGLAAVTAWRTGGSFAAWKKAFLKHEVTPTGPKKRVPTSRELGAQKRAGLNVVA
jgi:radical SAM superfamily enzyme YgiQ (UPF0313 family)